jgi:hypothetical protein
MGTFVLGGQTVNGNPTGNQNINITTNTVPSITFNDVDNIFGPPVAGESVTFTYSGTTYTNATYTLLGFGNVRGNPAGYAGFIRVNIGGGQFLTLALDMTPNDGGPYPNLQNGNTQLSPNTLTTAGPYPDFPVPCFVVGTMIDTPDGPRPVEELAPGDLVLTRDNGARPLIWTGRRKVPGWGAMAPIRFETGTIGNTAPLLVSPQHRVLLTGWLAELHAGDDEVLVPAIALVNDGSVRRAPRPEVEYVHILFDRHEIVTSEGAPTESFNPGDTILAGDEALRDEFKTLFPERFNGNEIIPYPMARKVAKAAEARLSLNV